MPKSITATEQPVAKSATETTASGTTTPEWHVIEVPLASLVLHQDNVRKGELDPEQTRELADSIAMIGLIQPPNCIPVKKGRAVRHHVIAGRRRLAALRLLEEENRLPATLRDAVPITVPKSAIDVTEVSFSENEIRQHMSTADQIQAWGQLHANGHSVEVIASRFGVANAHVKRLLRLAGVARPVLDAFRAETIDLDALKAFAVTDDQDRQLEVFNAVDPDHTWNLAGRVRKMITCDGDTMAGRLARFVTIKTYREAGGAVLEDLFSEDDRATVLTDTVLLRKLADEKIAGIQSRLEGEGWLWVKQVEGLYENEVYNTRHLVMQGTEPTETEADRLNEIEEIFHDDDQDQEALEAEQQQILEAMAARGCWTDGQKAIAGVFFCIDHHGDVEMRRGCVRRADDPDVPASEKNGEKPVMNAKLTEDLGRLRTQIVQAHLIGDPELARDIVEYNIATRAIGQFHAGFGGIGFAGSTITHDSDKLPFGARLDTAKAALDTSWWTENGTERDRFIAFRALPAGARSDLVAYAVAMLVSVPHAGERHASEISEEVVAHLAIDWPAAWRPDEAFWKRLSKPSGSACRKTGSRNSSCRFWARAG